jgi:hypothetical protein
MEALTRGSVPILEEDSLSLYDIGLRDRWNCVIVKERRWAAAVRRAAATNYAHLVEMRLNIRGMKEKYLSRAASLSRIARRLGVSNVVSA